MLMTILKDPKKNESKSDDVEHDGDIAPVDSSSNCVNKGFARRKLDNECGYIHLTA